MPVSSVASVDIFIAEVEAFGGAERADLALSSWLYAHDIPNRVLTYSDRVGLERHVAHPLEIVQLKPAGGVRAKVAALQKHFRDGSTQPRLIVSGYQPALHATLAGLRGFHCLMHDTPALLSDVGRRSLKGKLRIAAQNFIIGRGLRSGGATIVTSEFLRAECRKDFGVEAAIARMGGLPPFDGFQLRPFMGDLNLVSVCRMEANKRIDWMLHSLAALEARTTPLSSSANWHLRLAGKGSQIDALKALALKLGIADRVQFLGFVPDDELQKLMRDAHLFLMPAMQGFGIPAVEAIQAGMPVLLHRESGVSDILLNTPWATVFTGGADAMTEALQAAVAGVIEGRHVGKPLPDISSEADWAERVAGLCGWT